MQTLPDIKHAYESSKELSHAHKMHLRPFMHCSFGIVAQSCNTKFLKICGMEVLEGLLTFSGDSALYQFPLCAIRIALGPKQHSYGPCFDKRPTSPSCRRKLPLYVECMQPASILQQAVVPISYRHALLTCK